MTFAHRRFSFVSNHFSIAFAKSQIAAGVLLSRKGRIFLRVASPRAKEMMVGLTRRLVAKGLELIAPSGTARALTEADIAVEIVKKLEKWLPNLIDSLIDGLAQLIFNTPRGKA